MVTEEKRVAIIGRLESKLKKQKEKLAQTKKEKKDEKNAALGPAFEAFYKNATPKEKTKISECIKANLTGKALDCALFHITQMDKKKAPTMSRTKRAIKKASDILKEAETAEVAPDTPENQALIQEK